MRKYLPLFLFFAVFNAVFMMLFIHAPTPQIVASALGAGVGTAAAQWFVDTRPLAPIKSVAAFVLATLMFVLYVLLATGATIALGLILGELGARFLASFVVFSGVRWLIETLTRK